MMNNAYYFNQGSKSCIYLQKEGTSLLLADIFSNCYSKESIKEIRDVSYIGGARIGMFSYLYWSGLKITKKRYAVLANYANLFVVKRI